MKEDKAFSNSNPALLQDRAKRQKRNPVSPNKYYAYDNLMSTEEERMIKLALKNSLVEQQSNEGVLDNIEEMPVFYPTTDEFSRPIEYIEKLFK